MAAMAPRAAMAAGAAVVLAATAVVAAMAVGVSSRVLRIQLYSLTRDQTWLPPSAIMMR